MVPLAAMLSVAENTWMAFAIMADAAKVRSRRIAKEDVSAKINGLGLSHKSPAAARQPGQLHCRIDCNEDVDVFRNRFSCQNGTEQ